MTILLIVMGVAGVYGIALTFWHQKLMIYLRAKHTLVWRGLSPLMLKENIWSYSTSFPIWSWRSLFFFLNQKYSELDDLAFVSRARRFRLALIAWLILLVALSVSALCWQAVFGSRA